MYLIKPCVSFIFSISVWPRWAPRGWSDPSTAWFLSCSVFLHDIELYKTFYPFSQSLPETVFRKTLLESLIQSSPVLDAKACNTGMVILAKLNEHQVLSQLFWLIWYKQELCLFSSLTSRFLCTSWFYFGQWLNFKLSLRLRKCRSNYNYNKGTFISLCCVQISPHEFNYEIKTQSLCNEKKVLFEPITMFLKTPLYSCFSSFLALHY